MKSVKTTQNTSKYVKFRNFDFQQEHWWIETIIFPKHNTLNHASTVKPMRLLKHSSKKAAFHGRCGSLMAWWCWIKNCCMIGTRKTQYMWPCFFGVHPLFLLSLAYCRGIMSLRISALICSLRLLSVVLYPFERIPATQNARQLMLSIWLFHVDKL